MSEPYPTPVIVRRYCGECGARMWHLQGTDVDACKRGHHEPCDAASCPSAEEAP